LKEILEQSLKSDRPTSAHQIAVSLGYSNDGYVHQKYPELCRAIGEKIALAKQDEPDKMRRALENALPEISCTDAFGTERSPGLLELKRLTGA
jgi:hypothetical protein